MDLRGATATKPTTLSPAAMNRLHKQAEDLEGVFLNTLTKEMFASIKTDGAFGGGFGEETWRSMQSEQLADDIAKSGGVGLAAASTRSLLDLQQAAAVPAQAGAAGESRP
jgi:Rod binding domain-containing protein